MQNIQLYINDELADLSEDTSIELTFQINNLADVANQAGNTSKQFKLPLTHRNRILLGFPDDIRFTTGVPYDYFDCRVIQDGVEVIPAGKGEINSVDDNSVDFVVLSGNVDFFDAIGGNIYDMNDSTSVWTQYGKVRPWAPYDHDWNVFNAATSQAKTDGWIWPVIDYGNIPVDDFTQPINVRQMRPGFFLHTAIDLLAQAAGYTINPDSFLLKQALYQKLIIPFANDGFQHGTDFQNQPDEFGMIAYTAVNQSATHYAISDPYGKGIFAFSNIQSDPSHQFDGRTFTAQHHITAEIDVVIPKFYFHGRWGGNSSSNINVIIYLQLASGGELQLATFNYDLMSVNTTREPGTSGGSRRGHFTFGVKKISTQQELLPGDRITIRWEFFNDRPEDFVMYAGASLTIKTNNQDVLYGQSIQCERILPDVSQKDLLKDTLQHFGITCQTDNIRKEITFSSFRDIVNNIPYAKDWTSKCVNQGKKVTTSLGGYSQINWLRYQYDDGDKTLKKYFADDKITINNKTINPTSPQIDLFNSIFAPTSNRPWYGGTIAQILKIDPLSEDLTSFSVSTKPRILVDNKIDLRQYGNKSVTFTDGDNSKNVIINDIISAPYFYKPDGEYNLCWNNKSNNGGGELPGLREIYYPELEHILQETKKVVRYFILTPRDIAELDLLVPVYLEQDSAYFYINKIENWKKGQPIKVELVRL